MIYKLIISNTNFIDFGKVGVYISFLNQLSRDAKHKDDCNLKVSLKDEFVYRNILHASALLWQYKRQNGEQTALTKADICRTIEEKEIDKDDRMVLKEFKDIESVHFLSHSYLGEKENTLHFQHQSFAEILLAEYYLKVIIKYAIEESTDIEEARIRLSIGLPTDQTIEFLKGLLVLLKECALGNPKDSTIKSKRELLIPLLASMAINKHNKKLYSTRLNATWFEKYEEEIFKNNKLNNEIIADFPITQKILDRIEILCRNIISSQKKYFLAEPSIHTVLFKNELLSINEYKSTNYEIDKWFALIAGNIIVNDLGDKVFFNSKTNVIDLFNIIRNWNFSFGQIPIWGQNLFLGINMENNNTLIQYEYLNMSNIDFSFSSFNGIHISNSELRNCNFSHSIFGSFHLYKSDITSTIFDNIILQDISENKLNFKDLKYSHRTFGNLSLTFCYIAQGVLFPAKLNDILKKTESGITNQGSDICVFNRKYINFDTYFNEYILPLRGVFKQVILLGKDARFIISSFKFEKESYSKYGENKLGFKNLKELFEELINNIEAEIKTETS